MRRPGRQRGVLRHGAGPARRHRLMDFGVAMGYGADDKPDFWIGQHDSRRWLPRVAHRVRGRRPGSGAGVLRRGGRRRRRGAARTPGLARVPRQTTTAPSCATPTATTSKPSATVPSSQRASRPVFVRVNVLPTAGTVVRPGCSVVSRLSDSGVRGRAWCSVVSRLSDSAWAVVTRRAYRSAAD